LLSQEVLNQYHTEQVKLSFVLFDEIEKASDALWNLLLGILDKATLTLGDNRKVDFSRAMIFMTSNLGASEMGALMSPKVGFGSVERARRTAAGDIDERLSEKLKNTSVEAARRKFTPEFINRLDKIVSFRPLGSEDLRKILDIELTLVQQRVFNTNADRAFIFKVTEAGKGYLLEEGTDLKYGARHLKRAIERLVVQPMSNLIATEQVRGGDWVKVDFDSAQRCMIFTKEAEGLPVAAMADLMDQPMSAPSLTMAAGAVYEPARPANAKSTRKG
jgi:ATP-dependent Clp protease ATP-binding subunit ClpA